MTGPIESLPPEVEALALQCLAGRVKKQLDLSKAEFSADYEPGEKRAFRSPVDDRKLGLIWRTDPDAQWVIVDRAALTEHLMGFPGNRETVVQIVGSAPLEEILPVLAEHAPHLIEDVEVLRDGVVEAALAQSRDTGQPAAPGIEKRKAGGALTVKPDVSAHLAIEGLIRAGLLQWDGRRALPASDGREAS